MYRRGNCSQIHERTLSMRFLGIILRFLRLEVSLYDVYITNQFQTNFAHGVGGGGAGIKPLVEVNVNSKEENSFFPIMSKNSASGVSSLNTGALASTLRTKQLTGSRQKLSAKS